MVLGCEKRSTLKLQDTRITPSKLGLVDQHVCLAFAGLNADARILIDRARVEAQSHRLTIEDPVSLEYITSYIAAVQQRYTQSGGVRPFGISTLVTGFDPGSSVPQLYLSEPSGVYSAWWVVSHLSLSLSLPTLESRKSSNSSVINYGDVDYKFIFHNRKANAIGRSAKTVSEFLEREYKDNMDRDQTTEFAIKALLEVVQSGARNVEIAVMAPGKPLEMLSVERIDELFKKIEQQKAEEAEGKRGTKAPQDATALLTRR